jgi:hypothetical protein
LPEVIKHFLVLGEATRLSYSEDQNCLSATLVGTLQININFSVDSSGDPICSFEWRRVTYAALEDFLSAVEDNVTLFMQQYDPNYEHYLYTWNRPDGGDGARDDDATPEEVPLREACLNGNIAEVKIILRSNPEFTGKALYLSASCQQYDLFRALWHFMSPSELRDAYLGRALLRLARDGSSLVFEMAKKAELISGDFVRVLLVHAAYFGRDDILRAWSLRKDFDSNHSKILMQRGYADFCVFGSSCPDFLFLADCARSSPQQQRHIVQRLNNALDSISIKFEYNGVECLAFVARRGTPELKGVVRHLLRNQKSGLETMVSAFRYSEIDKATFWGLMDLTGVSTDDVASALVNVPPYLHRTVIKLLPASGRSLTPLILASLRDGESKLFEAYVDDLDFSYRDDRGNSFLHNAVGYHSNSACFWVALQRGVDPNCRNNRGDTPLHSLMSCREWTDIVECTRALIASGADCSATNNGGYPVIGSATPEILLQLRASGEFPQLFEPQLLSEAFRKSLERGDFACVAVFVDWEVPVPNLPDGRSILHFVASSFDADLTKKLILRFPHMINAEALNGDTPLKSAFDSKVYPATTIIFQHGGRYSKDDVTYEKIFSAALEAGNADLLDLLLAPPFVESINPASLKKSLLSDAIYCS